MGAESSHHPIAAGGGRRTCVVRAGRPGAGPWLAGALVALFLTLPGGGLVECRGGAEAAPRRAPAAGSGLPAASLAGQPDHVRVFNANILYCDPLLREAPADYLERRERLVRLLARLQPDVIVLQEVSECLLYDPPVRTALALAADLEALGVHYEHRFWISEGVPGVWREGLGYFWNPRRVVPADAGLACDHLPQSYVHGPLRITKSVCRFPVRPAGRMTGCPHGVRPLTIVNTHLDARRPPVRDAQAAYVAALLASELAADRPALLAGDLNGFRMARFFVDSGWWHVRRSHVDYLLARGLAPDDVLATRVVPLRADGVSDHDALAAELRWTCEAPSSPQAEVTPIEVAPES